ncbi:2-keto-4-pentenoate hydratase [Methylobacterium sp. ID0610]|uniref:2-keto-4-pentenoate hydratase n=1 Tax=Methylobacterium carpenticola TaxID=3344827 RepID=UPI0036A94A6A
MDDLTRPTPDAIAGLLLAARSGAPLPWRRALPRDAAEAYAVQARTIAALGAVGGWKVGAKGPDATVSGAPLPATGILASGAVLRGAGWRVRGLEVEVGLRLGRDLSPDEADPLAAVEAVLPLIEVVESRLADWQAADPLARLADLQSHGALVLGAPAACDPRMLDLRQVEAVLTIDGKEAARTRGGNPAGDVRRLLGWLARHCAETSGRPPRAGEVIATGSCTGMIFVSEGARVAGRLTGLGDVTLEF